MKLINTNNVQRYFTSQKTMKHLIKSGLNLSAEKSGNHQITLFCSVHFESKYLIYGKQRIRLNFELDPVPTIYPANHIPQSSMLPSVSCNIPRKAPRDRSLPDECVHFVQKDKINDFDSLDQFVALMALPSKCLKSMSFIFTYFQALLLFQKLLSQL